MTYLLWERIVFRLTGRWPQSVVDRRLAELDARPKLTPEDLARLALKDARERRS